MSDLSELSKSYYSQADIYKIFSDAEDKPGKILAALKKHLGGKVLDVGCGNGKYCDLLSRYADMVGVDKAGGQLSQACSGLKLVQADCMALPFKRVFDYAIACWMLGTLTSVTDVADITNMKSRPQLALEQIKQTLKPNGSIILIENDTNSEFEAIRGRDKDSRTHDYNEFLLSQGFCVIEKIDTYFEFENTEVANCCLSAIWGEKIQFRLKTNWLEHRVLVLAKKI